MRSSPNRDPEVLEFLGRLAEADSGPQGAAPYRGGEVTRLNKSWQPDHYAPDSAVAEGWDLLTRRILDLQRNDPVMIALRRTLVDHVVATGLMTTANVMIAGELEEDFNAQADDEFDWWAENEADFSGKLAWPEIQRQAFAELLDTGAALLLRCQENAAGRTVPLCYQTLLAEQLDESKDWPAGRGRNKCVRGIEVDRFDRPVAYWLFDAHPGDAYASTYASEPISASRVIHITSPGRPGQIHGISLYSAITQTAWDLDNYLGSELTAANIGALFSLIHKTASPTSGFGFAGDGSDTATTDVYGNPKVRLGRGIVCQIPREDDIEQVQANRPNAQAKVFTDLMMMLLAMGGNVSTYRLTRDYRSTTYVAARAARLDDAAAFAPLQGFLGRQLCLQVRHDWTAQAVAFGVLDTVSPAIYRKNRRRWDRLLLQPPGIPQIDMEKETDADIAAIGAGFETLESVGSRRGKPWRKVILQRKREIEFERKHLGPLGVELSYDRPSTPGKRASDDVPAPAPGNGPEDE